MNINPALVLRFAIASAVSFVLLFFSSVPMPVNMVVGQESDKLTVDRIGLKVDPANGIVKVVDRQTGELLKSFVKTASADETNINSELELIDLQHPAPGATPPGGIFPITATFKNIGTQNLKGIFFRVVVLQYTQATSEQPELANCDRNCPGVGAEIDAMINGGVLEPDETFAITFEILLPLIQSFAFFVDALATGVALLPAGQGATIVGDDGSSVTIQPNSMLYSAEIEVNLVPASELVAPVGDLDLVEVLELKIKPTSVGSVPQITAPLQLSIPAPPGTSPDAKFLVGQQMQVLSPLEPEEDYQDLLVLMDTASVQGGNIVTDTDILPGVFGGGLFAYVAITGSGFADGVITDAAGSPRQGVVVANNTNTFTSISRAAGRYTNFVSGGPFTLTAVDPIMGTSGSATGEIVVPLSTVQVDIQLSAVPTIALNGIRNGGFERCDLSSWLVQGVATAVALFPQGGTSTGQFVHPSEGFCMADIHTGAGAFQDRISTIKQSFRVPDGVRGVRQLRFDYNIVSEEFPENISTDGFQFRVTSPLGEVAFEVLTNDPPVPIIEIGDCFFPGGDNTCGQTGWQTVSLDLTDILYPPVPPNTADPVTVVDLEITVVETADGTDTHVLVDNIRFSTVWIHVQVLKDESNPNNGSVATDTTLRDELLKANEILSQAGINVRVRTFEDALLVPGDLIDIEAPTKSGSPPTCASGQSNLIPSPEVKTVLQKSRSIIPEDINVYHARTLRESPQKPFSGLAVGPDDYCLEVTILGNSGIVLSDSAIKQTLAHEFGHLLISPQSTGHEFEHGMFAGNFMSIDGIFENNIALTRFQSQNINRQGAPLLQD